MTAVLNLALAGMAEGDATVVERAANLGGEDLLLFGAWQEVELAGAIAAVLQPGRVANIYPPVALLQNLAAEHLLVQHATQDLAARTLTMVQSLLRRNDPAEAIFEFAGFERLANLVYLVAETAAPPSPASKINVLAEIDFDPLSRENEARFRETLEKTFEATLDCPRLNGVRDTSDVLASYRATGNYDPRFWFLIRSGENDVGCVLLTLHGEDGPCELVYFGVTPEQRGKGYANAVLSHAIATAKNAGRTQIVAGVDAANAPALAAYTRAGFTVWDERVAWARIF